VTAYIKLLNEQLNAAVAIEQAERAERERADTMAARERLTADRRAAFSAIGNHP
jgi:hypothetical protein